MTEKDISLSPKRYRCQDKRENPKKDTSRPDTRPEPVGTTEPSKASAQLTSFRRGRGLRFPKISISIFFFFFSHILGPPYAARRSRLRRPSTPRERRASASGIVDSCSRSSRTRSQNSPSRERERLYRVRREGPLARARASKKQQQNSLSLQREVEET